MYRYLIPVGLVVLATLTLGVGGAAAVGFDDGAHHDLIPRNGTNETTEQYRGYEPSREWVDKPVNMDSAPEDFTPSDDASASSDDGTASSSSGPEGMVRYYLTSGPSGYEFTEFRLYHVGDNIEVWVATDLSWGVAGDRPTPSISENQTEAIAAEFDENMYPTESELFGTPDPRSGNESLLEQAGSVPEDYYYTGPGSANRTVLLVQNIRDKNYYDPSYPLYIAGYYSPTVQQYSDRNVITVDAYGWDEVNATDTTVGYEGTLAHEYQHLIHGDLDPDETTWVNEGLSDLAETATGYGVAEGHLSAYEQLPSNSLTNWEDQGAINVLADYGAAYAFQMYLWDAHGDAFVHDLANDDRNGIASVEHQLDRYGDKRDFYGVYQDFATAAVTDTVERPNKDEYSIDRLDVSVNTSTDTKTAGAWGTNYREIDTSETGPITGVEVSGTDYIGTQWSTVETERGPALYSGSGNLLDRHAVRRVDLTNASNATLTFETKYDIESNWDYGFVQVSTDGGETWTSLSNADTDDSPTASAHPRVKANVPGFTGESDGWESQSFDLSAYEGEEILVSFRYTTDWAFVQPGWYVRNVSVAGQQFSNDASDYLSEREARNDRVEYQFSFIGIKENGNYQVKQLDMRTFDESDEQELQQFLHNGNFEKVVVASTWAAKSGESGRVPVGVEFEYARENGNSDAGNGNGN
ncbi:immune inhibitor A domain-containing protein [Halorarius halobius]|uniref:immune inhibitor A domain-containing protein n=1 Tax=Halorarius halobius TaxID=2962671 RepID=UPI0020CBAFE4|nr:immune inhibitor A domain-containing protein [Halorarius halobius]